MGPMKWLSPELGVGAAAVFVIVMIGFMFLRRFMMDGRKGMGGPGKMGKWNRMGGRGPTDAGSTTEASQSVKSCPSCGQPIQVGWKACPHCGETLV